MLSLIIIHIECCGKKFMLSFCNVRSFEWDWLHCNFTLSCRPLYRVYSFVFRTRIQLIAFQVFLFDPVSRGKIPVKLGIKFQSVAVSCVNFLLYV